MAELMRRRDPLREVRELERTVDRLFESVLGPWYRPIADSGYLGARHVPVDVYTTDEHVVILASLPGLRPEDVDVIEHPGGLGSRGSVF